MIVRRWMGWCLALSLSAAHAHPQVGAPAATTSAATVSVAAPSSPATPATVVLTVTAASGTSQRLAQVYRNDGPQLDAASVPALKDQHSVFITLVEPVLQPWSTQTNQALRWTWLDDHGLVLGTTDTPVCALDCGTVVPPMGTRYAWVQPTQGKPLTATPGSQVQWVDAPAMAWVQALRADVERLKARNAPALALDGLPAFKKGQASDQVGPLVDALTARGFTSEAPVSRTTYDATVMALVSQAQAAYGLIPDGLAGEQLYGNLRTSDAAMAQGLSVWADTVQAKVDAARAAGDRKLIVVNIPSYTLHALDLTTGQTAVESRVVVGMPSRRTPRMDTRIINLKFNPDWTPPPSLVRTGHVYVKPGPNNPLGLLRFSTDNKVDIYLHDTNQHNFFERALRAKSSGCVRVQDWKALAAFIQDTTVEAIDQTFESLDGKTQYVKVPSVPVSINYALVDTVGGQPGRYPDVYDLKEGALAAPSDATELEQTQSGP